MTTIESAATAIRAPGAEYEVDEAGSVSHDSVAVATATGVRPRSFWRSGREVRPAAYTGRPGALPAFCESCSRACVVARL
jgi:hypothetical protein